MAHTVGHIVVGIVVGTVGLVGSGRIAAGTVADIVACIGLELESEQRRIVHRLAYTMVDSIVELGWL